MRKIFQASILVLVAASSFYTLAFADTLPGPCRPGVPSDCPSGYACQEGVCTSVPPGTVVIQNPLSSNTFTDLLNTVLDFIFNIALIVAPLMVVFAGFLFVTGGGDPAKLNKAKDILIWTAIGFGIILLSKGFPLLIKDILGLNK